MGIRAAEVGLSEIGAHAADEEVAAGPSPFAVASPEQGLSSLSGEWASVGATANRARRLGTLG